MNHVVVGTAGHIDHGKSALVRALTGTDPDRLEEEKRRGITIDLGFAHFDVSSELRVGFIDVPGHERFIKNMLAGVGGIDLVLLVIAADESIKPQTREHFEICKLLGIKKGIIVITKSDLVDREILELVKLEVQDFVAGSFLEGAPIVAVSSRTGEGLEELKAQLRAIGAEAPPRGFESPFRLPIDRAFVMKGFGAVVTGTLIAGRVEKEAEVEVFPIRHRVRVRGIEVHNSAARAAVAGQRTALNLAGIEARELERGMMLAPPDLFEATSRLDCSLSLLPSARPLKNHAKVHFHCWSAEMLAEVVFLSTKELEPGERAFAQLRLAAPGLFLPGDRFIIRQFSPVTTIGGGTVLDSQPDRHRHGDPNVARFLEVAERGAPDERLELLAKQSGELAVSAVAVRTGWPPLETLRVAKALEKTKRLLVLGQPAAAGQPPSLLVHPEHFRALSDRVAEILQEFHARNPLLPGMTKEELRGRVGAPSLQLFNAVLRSLGTESRVEVQGETVRVAGRAVQLTAEELKAKEQISHAFEAAGLEVPSVLEVLGKLPIDQPRAEKILQILLREKLLVRVAEDLIFHASALQKLRELLARRKQESNRINVTTFKELTGLSRKYAIPLLEHLDRERITRREGDERIIL